MTANGEVRVKVEGLKKLFPISKGLFSKITDYVHQFGAKMFAQLNHNGQQCDGTISRRPVWAPSPVPDVLFREVPKEMEPEDITGDAVAGGYLLELDERLEANNEPGWRTPLNVPVVVKEPDPAAPEQRSYIRSFVNSFEDLLFSPGFADPVTGYASVLDVDAFVDHWMLQEVTRNGDSFWSSTFSACRTR